MDIFIATQTLVFFEACLLGAALGAFYDVFRVMRMIAKIPKLIVALLDILYCAVLIIASFSFVLSFNDGKLRVFILIGEILGGTLYFFTVSLVVLKIMKWIIFVVKKLFSVIFKIIYRIIFCPFIWIYKKIKTLVDKILGYFGTKFKKFGKNTYLLLKTKFNMLYNIKMKSKKNIAKVDLNGCEEKQEK